MTTIQEFDRSVSIQHNKLTTRPKFIGAVIATVLSRHLPLPTSKVETLEDYYNINCTPITNVILSELNEKLIMDVRLAADYTRRWWKLRYCTAFPKPLFVLKTNYGMVDTYVNTGDVWSEVDHSFINEIKDDLVICSLTCEKMLAEHFPSYVNQ